MNGKSLYLIDGSAMFYRAYFAFIRTPLINSKGENTSASYGLINSLFKIMRDENPDYMTVIFDTKAPTFRHKMYDEYKSTRAKMPDELVEQLPRIHEAVGALGLSELELEGFEADDIIGTLAKMGEAKGMNVWIVSGDKDMFQLVTDKVKIYNPQKLSQPAIRMDAEAVQKKFGVYPDRVIDMLALMGDSSDNVPGIPGVGPKTAINLLKQFGSLEEVLANHAQIKAKGIRNKVENNIDKAQLSKKLVTIDTAVPIDCKLTDLKRSGIDFETARKFFVDMEFTSLLNQLAKISGKLDLIIDEDKYNKMSQPELHYKCINSLDELKTLVGEFSTRKEIALDTETTSLNSLTAELVGVSLCAEPGKAYYVPIGHEEKERNLPRQEALKILSKLFKNGKVQKFGQNIKYDLQILHGAGMEVRPISFDTMVASYVIASAGRRHGLDALALEHFNHQMQPISDLIGKGKKQISFARVEVDRAVPYACEDADYTYRLRGMQAPKIDELKLTHLYYDIELPLIRVLSDMEEVGIRIDTDYLGELSKEMEAGMEKLTGEIYSTAGHEFNINSTKQLATVLFEELKLPTKGKTAKKTGYSTDVKVLEELAGIHDLPKLILDFRQLGKLKSTYVDAIPRLVNPNTGRVHTSFNQTVASTGRLSSTDPNLQNIPIRTEQGRQIRKAFIPRDENHRLLMADYSQVELRILAHYSNDETLISAFNNNEDIHSRTAAEVYGVAMEHVTPEMRRSAKTANFAIIYGVSAFGLSQQTELDLTQSKDFIDTYLDRYPGIRKYMDDMIAFARQHKYVRTLLGRIRHLPEIDTKNWNMRQFAERIAINTPIQGTAADMIKIAMIKIANKIYKMKSKMVLQVHDELVFDAHIDELDELRQIVKKEMESAIKLKAPIIVDMGVGDNWLDAK